MPQRNAIKPEDDGSQGGLKIGRLIMLIAVFGVCIYLNYMVWTG